MTCHFEMLVPYSHGNQIICQCGFWMPRVCTIIHPASILPDLFLLFYNIPFSLKWSTLGHFFEPLYIVHYLSSTTNLCIQYSASGNQNGLIAYSDTDWAGDHKTSCSTTGYAMFLANSIVSWLSRQQKKGGVLWYDWDCKVVTVDLQYL